MRTYGSMRLKEDLSRCVEPVWVHGGGMIETQCSRKRGHGPSGEYCKQHAEKIARRAVATQSAYIQKQAGGE